MGVLEINIIEVGKSEKGTEYQASIKAKNFNKHHAMDQLAVIIIEMTKDNEELRSEFMSHFLSKCFNN